jgi:hypothetical protein
VKKERKFNMMNVKSKKKLQQNDIAFKIKKKQMGFFPIKYEDSYKLNQKKKKLRWAKENALISSIFNFN